MPWRIFSNQKPPTRTIRGQPTTPRAAIREFFVAASGRFPYAAHLVTNPIIVVDGDQATGSWRMLMPCILKDGDGERSAMLFRVGEEYQRATDWHLREPTIVREKN